MADEDIDTDVPANGMAGMEINPAGGESSIKKTPKSKSAAVSGPKDRFEVKKVRGLIHKMCNLL